MDNDDRKLEALKSIDRSLQLLVANKTGAPAKLSSRTEVAAALGVPTVAVDRMIHEGIASGGKRGLLERVHYVKLDPRETNTAKFLFHLPKVVQTVWEGFSRT